MEKKECHNPQRKEKRTPEKQPSGAEGFKTWLEEGWGIRKKVAVPQKEMWPLRFSVVAGGKGF